MWRFNYGANRLLDSTFVICRPLICTNWIYIVWECSYFFNLPLNRQISACSWSVHFIHFRSFKPPQSFLVTVCRSKPPQPFHPLLNWSTSLRFPERGLGGKIKWHCLPLTWHSKPKCAIVKLKHIGFIHYTTRFGFESVGLYPKFCGIILLYWKVLTHFNELSADVAVPP